ncbi:MAG TPA: phage holin family protein [Steroidobacteraceae bacterium]
MIESPGRPAEPRLSGFLNSVGQLAMTALEMAHTRLELAFLELQEGLESLVSLVLWGAIAVLAAFMGLLFGGLALIFAFWDTHRILVAVLLMVGFLLLATLAAWAALAKVQLQRNLFGATLGELAKDRTIVGPVP